MAKTVGQLKQDKTKLRRTIKALKQIIDELLFDCELANIGRAASTERDVKKAISGSYKLKEEINKGK